MVTNKMGIKTIDIIATLTINLLHYAYSDHILSCNVTSLEPCQGDNQFCSQTLGCVCIKGYIRVGADCEARNSASSNHGVTAVVVSIFTIVLIACGLFLVIRKYNLVDYFWQKINMRRNNDVMYEDVMIGNDDPPLSP